MKLPVFMGLCLLLQVALAAHSILPPPVHHEDDERIQKRDVFVPGKDKIPPFRPQKDENVEKTFGRQSRSVEKIPPIISEEGDKINGQFADHLDKNFRDFELKKQSLPLLLKTLRLRPGSKAYNEIVEKFVREQKVIEKREVGKDNGDDDVRLLGEPLIGKNRHPKKGDREDEQVPDDLQHNSHFGDGSDLGKPVNIDNDKEDIKLPGANMIGKNRHPKGDREDEQVPDDLQHNSHFGDGSDLGKQVNTENGDDDVKLPGEHMIGKNRHPKGDNNRPYDEKEGIMGHKPHSGEHNKDENVEKFVHHPKGVLPRSSESLESHENDDHSLGA